jgi:glycosyltransferase involved in cell wall biosynthesis
MTVGLVMIVKDEERVLPRVAESVRDHIDYWTVVDTGSTDGTLEVLDRVFTPVPGQVIRHEFDGFGPSRNVGLRAAEQHTDWMLCLDADEEFIGIIDVEGVEADSVEAEQYNGDMRFWLPRLLRSGRGWESRGRAHEYYTSPIASPPVRTQSFHVVHHGDGVDRPHKYSRDIPLLLQDYEEDNNNERAAFYLGRSYLENNQLDEAATWLRRRVLMPGWVEETFYARYLLGLCLLQFGANEEACGHLWRAWGEQTHRAEPLMALAEHYRTTEQWHLAWMAASNAFSWCLAQPGNRLPTYDGLFVDITATEWRAAYEQSVSAWYTGNKERGKTLTKWLLERTDLPDHYMASVRANANFYLA